MIIENKTLVQKEIEMIDDENSGTECPFCGYFNMLSEPFGENDLCQHYMKANYDKIIFGKDRDESRRTTCQK